VNAERWARLSSEFERLCDLPPDERARQLAALSAVDAAFAAEVSAMLAADARTGGALAGSALALAAPPADESTADGAVRIGARLGAWRLIERLGAGGMGEVWVAERADGTFEQRVAMKLLKRGLETDALLARFALERRILARLTHPGIARLLDAGSSGDGRPYFVLERVEGRPITVWADERKLPVAARLRLMLQVADAVDFAHRNLVVHRDLKPSNVFVTDAGEVKLLDFGVAKILETEGDGAKTELEGRALTPQYAAPEQLRGEPVTTATDVYALGVMLYELLTGRLPHQRRRASLAELAAQVEHETVERPSSAARRGEAGAGPGADRERVARELAGDLDTLALKALAREPERRYPSAAALTDDLRRYLDGRPIAARPDTVGYRLGKLVRRHRLAFAAAAAALLALVAGLAAALWQADRATRRLSGLRLREP
jgi:serine/threonine-protein kinase